MHAHTTTYLCYSPQVAAWMTEYRHAFVSVSSCFELTLAHWWKQKKRIRKRSISKEKENFVKNTQTTTFKGKWESQFSYERDTKGLSFVFETSFTCFPISLTCHKQKLQFVYRHAKKHNAPLGAITALTCIQQSALSPHSFLQHRLHTFPSAAHAINKSSNSWRISKWTQARAWYIAMEEE